MRLAVTTSALLVVGCLVGCIGVSAPKKPGSGPKTVAPTTKLKRCENPKVAEDAPIDDFEDANTQLMTVGARDGYWWKSADPKGSKFEPDELKFEEPGATKDSFKALHATGMTVTGQDAYGVLFGVNFSSNSGEAALYDASPYAGIAFKVKGDPGKATKVRFKVADVNTHPDLGVCTTCWNHFGKNIELTPEWTEHKVLFADLKQADGWGAPRPPHLVVEKLYSFDFAFEGGGEFGIWVDDVSFVVCP